MTDETIYEGVAASFEEALRVAHMKIPMLAGTDYTISKIVNSGMQFGGFMSATLFYVQVIPDRKSPFKTEDKKD